MTQREGEDRSRKGDREETTEKGGGAPEGRKHVQATASSPDHSVQMQQHRITHSALRLGGVGVRTMSYPNPFEGTCLKAAEWITLLSLFSNRAVDSGDDCGHSILQKKLVG